jgi:hypothetical protein
MIAQILKHTPGWVFVLFFALLYLGYRFSRPRTMSAFGLFALPVAMLGLSLFAVWSSFGAHVAGFLAWVCGSGVASLLYEPFGRSNKATYLPSSGRFALPGSWLPLALIMTMFLARYAVTATLATNPSLRQAVVLQAVAGAVYGFLSTALFARALYGWRNVASEPAGPDTGGARLGGHEQ